MKYDFTSRMDRAGHDAIALDMIPIPGAEVKEGFSKIPMWVADMNFPVFPEIQNAVHARVNEPHFGYFTLTDEYYNSIINWQKDRNGVENLSKEDIGYENGVLGCVSTCLHAFTAPSEAVLVNGPLYIGFTSVLDSTARKVVISDLVKDDNNIWRMDLKDMEEKIIKNHIHTVIFCSPHNPSGRVWEKEEIEAAMALFEKYECNVISDEIWSDIILPGHKHIPTQSVSEYARNNTIGIYAPSKTFNLAGLIGSYHIVYNPRLRDSMDLISKATHYNSCNVLSMHALIGAYKPEGRDWVDQLCETIDKNIQYACDFIEKNFDGVEFGYPQGTYMLYLDVGKWLKDHNMTCDELLKKGVEVGVIWQDGRPFKMDNTIRMNFALPYEFVVEAMNRLNIYVFNS